MDTQIILSDKIVLNLKAFKPCKGCIDNIKLIEELTKSGEHVIITVSGAKHIISDRL